MEKEYRKSSQDLRLLKSEGRLLVVVAVHWGEEEEEMIRGELWTEG